MDVKRPLGQLCICAALALVGLVMRLGAGDDATKPLPDADAELIYSTGGALLGIAALGAVIVLIRLGRGLLND